jgi:hypothetical protein
MTTSSNSPARAKNILTKRTAAPDRNQDKKNEIRTFKYSQNLHGTLHEAAIVGGVPAFLAYDQAEQKIRIVTSIDEPTRTILPVEKESYPYGPYEFVNLKEVEAIFREAQAETIDTVYEKARLLVEKFNDQDSTKTVLLAADIVWSYHQDKFSTTHYLDLVGDNGSGKSTMGETFAVLGYRVVNITDPTAPNYFRVCGSLEPGQCTIVADEAETIDKSPELMSFLKAGYDINGRVSRINPFTNRPEYFFAYCLKIIIAEKSPDQWRAKGVMDRTFVLHCYRGKPEYDIKEVLVPAGNKRRQRLLNELLHLRKLLLLYRLVHYTDPLVDLEVGVEGRDKELCKPLLQLFYNSSVRYDIIVALQKLLDEKNERRQNTLESALYPIVRDLVKQKGSEVYVATLWQEITSRIDGNHDDKKPFQYETREHGTLYYNTVTKLMIDKFGAKSKRKSGGAMLIFDKDKLERFARAYAIAEAESGNKIRIKPIEDEEDDNNSNSDSEQEEEQVKSTDGNEGSEGFQRLPITLSI